MVSFHDLGLCPSQEEHPVRGVGEGSPSFPLTLETALWATSCACLGAFCQCDTSITSRTGFSCTDLFGGKKSRKIS